MLEELCQGLNIFRQVAQQGSRQFSRPPSPQQQAARGKIAFSMSRRVNNTRPGRLTDVERTTSQIKFIKNMEMEDCDQPGSAVDPARFLPNIIRYRPSERDASCLALDAQFMNAHFRAH
jgi:hypothetical protein